MKVPIWLAQLKEALGDVIRSDLWKKNGCFSPPLRVAKATRGHSWFLVVIFLGETTYVAP